MCWGRNDKGQLGDASNQDSSIPVPVAGLASAQAIGVGQNHSCAAIAIGAVCWGDNGHGQLGNGLTLDSNVPVAVAGLTGGVVQLVGGEGHTCALLDNGSVECWGWNDKGQLGDGTQLTRSTPAPVLLLGGPATSIAASSKHTCAVVSGVGVQCWGHNNHGQLGDGSTSDSSVPLTVPGTLGALEVTAGWEHTCAILPGGAVSCWGRNDQDQLGIGGGGDQSSPVAVTLPETVAIAAGDDFTCAVLATDEGRCWGENNHGQLGTGDQVKASIPAIMSGLPAGASQITAGFEFACAFHTSGLFTCWGTNGRGQLGNNSTTDSSVPVGVWGTP